MDGIAGGAATTAAAAASVAHRPNARAPTAGDDAIAANVGFGSASSEDGGAGEAREAREGEGQRFL